MPAGIGQIDWIRVRVQPPIIRHRLIIIPSPRIPAYKPPHPRRIIPGAQVDQAGRVCPFPCEAIAGRPAARAIQHLSMSDDG